MTAAVEKRPLSDSSKAARTSAKASAKSAKAKKIPRIPLLGKKTEKKTPGDTDKIMQEALDAAATMGDAQMKIPRPQFVNTEKITKRPLSKNVYQPRKVVETKEVPKGPVTIIEKAEKDSRVGLIVTIIITIILGAAAGTVAFLLLPK